MATAFVQDKVGSEDSGTPNAQIQATFDANVTAGAAIVVTGCWGSNDQTPTCTDSLGNSYGAPVLIDFDSNSQGMATWVALNSPGGACTVTVAFSPSSPYNRIGITEVSGAHASAAVDIARHQQQAFNTGTNGISSTAGTPSENGEYIYGATQNTADGGVGISAGTGFTLRSTVAGVVFALESQVQATAASVAATFTWASGDHQTITHMVTLKEAAAGGGGGGPTPNSLRLMGVGK